MKILIVVDMQNDFVTGPLGSPDAVRVSSKIKDLIQNSDYDHVIFTQDTHDDNYLNTKEGQKLPVPHCIINTDGWQIVSELAEEFGGSPFTVQKGVFGFNYWDELLSEHFEMDYFGDNTIDLVGVCTDICVVSNALILKALFPRADIRVISDCCAGTSIANHLAAITTMRSCQVDIL